MIEKFKEGFRHILKINDPPEKIAFAFAIGVFVAFSPLLGLHFILACVLAMVFRLRIRVALLGCAVGNPWTMPFIYGGSFFLGNRIIKTKTPFNLNYFISIADQLGASIVSLDFGSFKVSILKLMTIALPFTVGTLVLGLISSVLSYIIIILLFNRYNKRRIRI